MRHTSTQYVFPVEIFDRIVSSLTSSDVAGVAASCRLLNTIATPKLYRCISFDALTRFGRVNALLATLRTSPRLARYLTELVLDWSQESTSRVRATPTSAFTFGRNVSLPQLRQLHVLGATMADPYVRGDPLGDPLPRRRKADNVNEQPLGTAVLLPLEIVHRVCRPELLTHLTFLHYPGQSWPANPPSFAQLTWLHLCSSRMLTFLLSGGPLDKLKTLIYSPEQYPRPTLNSDMVRYRDFRQFIQHAHDLSDLRELVLGAWCLDNLSNGLTPTPFERVTHVGFSILCNLLALQLPRDDAILGFMMHSIRVWFPRAEVLELRCCKRGWGVKSSGLEAVPAMMDLNEADDANGNSQTDEQGWCRDLTLPDGTQCTSCRKSTTPVGEAALACLIATEIGPAFPSDLATIRVSPEVWFTRVTRENSQEWISQRSSESEDEEDTTRHS